MSVKDMVLHCNDFGLMRRLSQELVRECCPDYSSNVQVEYEIMRKEITLGESLYALFVDHYIFYHYSDKLWEYTKRFFTSKPQHIRLVLYFEDCAVICNNIQEYNYIDKDNIHLFNPVIVGWENIECLLKGSCVDN